MEGVAGDARSDSDLDEVVAELGKLFDAGRKDILLGAVRSVLSAARTENLLLTQKVVELTKKVYGRSSERVDPNQLRLAFDELRQDLSVPADAPAPDAMLPDDPPRTRKRGDGNGRRPLPAELPREEVRIAPTEEQLTDRVGMTKVGEERSIRPTARTYCDARLHGH